MRQISDFKDEQIIWRTTEANLAIAEPGTRAQPRPAATTAHVDQFGTSNRSIPQPRRLLLPSIELCGRNLSRESLSSQRVLNEKVTALYNDHHEAICRFARLFLGNRGDAEEVAQEMYAKLLEGRAALPLAVSRSWLYRVVLNACRDHRKSWWSRLQRSSVDVTVLEALVDCHPTPETALLDSEKETALMNVLRSLPLRLRAAVILRDIEGLSYEDIAASLGCGIGTVSSKLNRARKILAQRLLRSTK